MYVGLAVAYVGETGLLHQLLPLALLPLTIGYLDHVVIPLEEKNCMGCLARSMGVIAAEFVDGFDPDNRVFNSSDATTLRGNFRVRNWRTSLEPWIASIEAFGF